MPVIKKRTRYFIGAEGDSEQSFIKWLQELSEQEGLHIHLDCHPLGGGGYSGMLKAAERYRQRGLAKGSYEASFMVVDTDRSQTGDWSIDQLRAEAERQKMAVCCQEPNIEGLFCRMFEGRERNIVNIMAVERQIKVLWPEYEKPADTRTLAGKFTLDDLRRVAGVDDDLGNLLRAIGLL